MWGKQLDEKGMRHSRDAKYRTIGAVLVYLYIFATFLSICANVEADNANTSTKAKEPQNLRVGAWNIKKLGHGDKKDYVAIAKVINCHFDVVAVVEVMQKGRGHPGYDHLKTELGSRWGGEITTRPRPNTSVGDAEYYAIFYRKDRIAICDNWSGLVYHEDNDGSGSEFTKDIFSREPAFACFQTHWVGTKKGFDFMLAAYHARWERGNKKKISAEVTRVVDVFGSMQAARTREKDLILVGDFNLNPSKLKDALNRQISIPEGGGSTLNESGARTKNIYDYLLLHDSNSTSEMNEQPRILDVRVIAADDRTFYQTISDHLPVVASFRTDGPDDD